jgi:hypothetical protein
MPVHTLGIMTAVALMRAAAVWPRLRFFRTDYRKIAIALIDPCKGGICCR